MQSQCNGNFGIVHHLNWYRARVSYIINFATEKINYTTHRHPNFHVQSFIQEFPKEQNFIFAVDRKTLQ